MGSQLTVDGVLKRIRFDHESKRGSVLDVIQLVTGCDSKHTTQTLQRILETTNAEFYTTQHQFPGRGQRPTPVATLPALVEIIMLCTGKTAMKWKLNAAKVLCRALGGDTTLARQVEVQAEVAKGTMLEHLRTCPDSSGWEPLARMDFSVEASDSDPAGIVYLAGAPEFALLKIGSWSGDESGLLSRYRTYYGPHTWVQSWRSADRRRDEAAALAALQEHSAGKELIYARALERAIATMRAILQPDVV